MFSGNENIEGILWGLGIASVVLFLGSVIVIPLIIAYLPPDYFVRTIKPFRELSVFHMITRIIKNAIGTLFVASGIIMLFIPGQGILTILLGISLLDFPGKRKLMVKILRSEKVKDFIAWCRRKSAHKPLEIPEA